MKCLLIPTALLRPLAIYELLNSIEESPNPFLYEGLYQVLLSELSHLQGRIPRPTKKDGVDYK